MCFSLCLEEPRPPRHLHATARHNPFLHLTYSSSFHVCERRGPLKYSNIRQMKRDTSEGERGKETRFMMTDEEGSDGDGWRKARGRGRGRRTRWKEA
ncbi:hypothetical protein E2C01_021298 [Portunus trituberculatus]|uniref:Uncharacterized protein n=1 Tax=Portunus trituberculatus TaxID=210409 RepID=A0A5B7E4A5_PORTR|nr:hypothetical protein [Portunus trituberculatus]